MVIYLGLGSNVGDRENHLRHAMATLGQNGVTVLRTASLYWTEPKDVTDQPWFVNTVLEASTNLMPHELLELSLDIERKAGRVRDFSKGPRPIDIDILLYGTEIIQRADLRVPHSRYTDRRFVLVPLVELNPDLRDPVSNLTVRELLEQCVDTAAVLPFGPPLL